MSTFEHSIQQIVQDIWDCVLQLPVEDEDPFRLSAAHESTYAGVVQISGAWEGAVALQCAEPLARRAAEIMLGLPSGEIGPDEVKDALGELGNMMGGNFKSLLPEPCRLSLPVVIEGSDYRLRLPGSSQILQCAFQTDGQPFTVTILQAITRNMAA
jgi:chemotaxis protein CheX